MNREELTVKLPYYIICAAIAAAALWLGVKYLLPAFLPFAIALAVAALIRRPVKFLKSKAHIPEKLSAALLVLLIVGLLSYVLYILLMRAYSEIESLSEGVTAFLDRLKNDDDYASGLIEKIASAVPFVDLRPRLTALWLDIDASLENLLLSVADRLSASALPFLAGMLTFVPNALLFVFVVLFSSFYLTVDGGRIKASLMSLLPEKAAARTESVISSLRATVGGITRAYALIMAITFTELFVFFSVIGIKYAFLIALFTSLVDILPVLGTGTVLLPWAAVLLLTGDTRTGIALLVAYGVITLIRELIEPRIVGKSIGISPLASLVAMYAGLELFGAAGLFVCPLVAILLQSIVNRKQTKEKKQ